MRKWMKRLGIGAGALVTLLLMAVLGMYGFSSSGIRHTYEVQTTTLQIPTDSASLAWGQHLATAIGKCTDCHGPDLAGKEFINDPAFGRLESSNLTKGQGGVGSTYSDADYVRALRHGVRPDGSPLLLMPSQQYTHMSDEDMGALIAYIRSMPPVDRTPAAKKVGPVARALYLTKKIPLVPAELIDHKVTNRPAVARGTTIEYGKYLVRIGGCMDCHGENLSGGPIAGPPGTPPARNLTPAGLGKWTYDDFKRALREGTRPDGTKLNPFMPFVYTAQLTDDEIKATWAYLQQIPAVETGTR